MRYRALMLVGYILCLGLSSTQGQETPVMPQKVWQALANELSGDMSFDYLRHLTLYHAVNGGSEGFRQEAEWVADKARNVGLENVRILWMEARSRGWDVLSGEAWIIKPEEMKLGDVRETPLRVADNSRNTDVTAELIDAGTGINDADYEGKDVKGKIVLASSEPNAVQRLAVWKYGALGVISYAARRDFLPDQLCWRSIATDSPDGKQKGTFAWMLTPREGKLLRARLVVSGQKEGGDKPKPVLVRVTISASFGEKKTGMVEGWIRGTGINNQDIILTSHMQEEKTSANDDRSGVASMLEIARTLVRLIDEGKLIRPKRNIRFWWVDEYSSACQYFSDNPDAVRHILVNLNQDMVGAKQSVGGRAQYLGRTPFSRPSFLNDVVESVLEAVRLGNTDFPFSPGWGMTESIIGSFSRPLLSVLGTREPYRAEAVPFFDGGDHQVFDDGRIGIPGVMLANWPDPYIHSSDDDLWQIDPTQLKRNAFIIGGSAYFIASAGEAEISRLAGLLMAGAQKRLANDSATALLLIHDESERTKADRYADACVLLDEAGKRELTSIDSARVFAEAGGAGEKMLNSTRRQVELLAKTLRANLDGFYQQAIGSLPSLELSAEEKSANQLTPEWILPLAESLKIIDSSAFWRFGNLSSNGLHPFYAYDVLNLINGKRTVLGIYHSVLAAALSAGEWYYGSATLGGVKEILERVEKTGAIRLNKLQ